MHVCLTCCPWSYGLRQKKEPLVSVAVPPTPVWVLSQRPLAPSIVSVTSIANDKGNNGANIMFFLAVRQTLKEKILKQDRYSVDQ